MKLQLPEMFCGQGIYILRKNVQKFYQNVLQYFALQIWKVFLPKKSTKFLYIAIFRFNIIYLYLGFCFEPKKHKHVTIHFLNTFKQVKNSLPAVFVIRTISDSYCYFLTFAAHGDSELFTLFTFDYPPTSQKGSTEDLPRQIRISSE